MVCRERKTTMISIDPKTQTPQDSYKMLIGTIIPRPVAFITTKSKEGVVNAAPFSYFNIIASTPPMVYVSVQRGPHQKDTAKNILQTKEFVVHIVDEDNVEEINKTAANLPYNQSELELTSLTLADSTKISVPGVSQAKFRMECVLEKALEFGEGDAVSCDLIIGKIVQYHISPDIYDNGEVNSLRLNAISRLEGDNYAKLGERFTVERPH